MSEHMDELRGWIDSFAADVAAVQAVAAGEKVARDARLAAAAALNYLVTRLDLIPDWEETCGILDDCMVMRLSMAAAEVHELTGLSEDTERAVHRMANEVDAMKKFLGDDLYAKLKRYVDDLAN